MKMSDEIAVVQVALILSGVFLISTLRFPAFGFNWLMSIFFCLTGAALGFRSLIRLRRSEDARDFLRSALLPPILFSAIALSFVVGGAVLFYNLALVGLGNANLLSVDASATFGLATIILSLVLAFVLSLLEAVWRARSG